MTRRIVRITHWTLGIALSLFLVAEALSGIVLLYQDAFDRVSLPSLHTVTSCSSMLPVDVLAERARAVLPGRVTSIDWDLDGAPDTVRFSAVDPHGQRIAAYLDPCNGRVAGVRPWEATLVGFATELHAKLFLGAPGHPIVFVLAVLTCVLALSGIVVWPGWKKFRLGFRFRKDARVFAKLYDLHVSGGIIISIALVILGVTGMALAESDGVQAVLTRIVAQPATEPMRHVLFNAVAKKYPMQAALDAVRARFPDSRTTEIALGAAPSSTILLYVRQHVEADEFGSTLAYADAATGDLMRVDDATRAPLAMRMMNGVLPLHMGTPFRFDARLLVAAVAVLIVASTITGIWIRILRW